MIEHISAPHAMPSSPLLAWVRRQHMGLSTQGADPPLTNFAAVESILLAVAHCCAAAVLGADLLDGAESAAQALVAMNLHSSQTPWLLL